MIEVVVAVAMIGGIVLLFWHAERRRARTGVHVSTMAGCCYQIGDEVMLCASRYLFAIGLPFIFSFRWNLPPT